jgi:exopolysaccharide production protein ExoZ
MKNDNFILIQVFRGFAAIMVMLYHYAGTLQTKFSIIPFNINIFEPGHVGVSFFFILSGFIIFYVHQNDFGKPQLVKNFFIKRFIRVYPIYWIMLAILIAFYSVADIFFSTNKLCSIADIFYFVKTLTLYPHPPDTYMLGPAWTLTFEIYFYLLFGAMLMVCNKKNFFVILAFYAFMIFLYQLPIKTFLNFYAIDSHYNFIFPTDIKYIIFNFNVIDFIIGSIIAFLAIKMTPNSGLPSAILITLGLFFFCCSWIATCSFPSLKLDCYLIRFITYSIPIAFLILGSAFYEKKHSIHVPIIFKKIGDASYSLYLMHTIILLALYRILKIVTANHLFIVSSFIISFFFTVLLSIVFHEKIEKKLLKYLRSNLLKT